MEGHHIEQNMNICRSVSRCCRDGHSSHKKDSKWAWMVCLAASTNMAFTAGLLFCFGVLLPVFMDYFNESRERTGMKSIKPPFPFDIEIMYRLNRSFNIPPGRLTFLKIIVQIPPYPGQNAVQILPHNRVHSCYQMPPSRGHFTGT